MPGNLVMLPHFHGVYKDEKKDCILLTKGELWATYIHRKYAPLNLSGKHAGYWKSV